MEEHPPMKVGLVPGVLRDYNLKIGRQIGKLPAGKGFREIEAFLRQVPAPADHNRGSSIVWAADAIRLLQRQRPTPWAEAFDVEKFTKNAYNHFNRPHAYASWRTYGPLAMS